MVYLHCTVPTFVLPLSRPPCFPGLCKSFALCCRPPNLLKLFLHFLSSLWNSHCDNWIVLWVSQSTKTGNCGLHYSKSNSKVRFQDLVGLSSIFKIYSFPNSFPHSFPNSFPNIAIAFFYILRLYNHEEKNEQTIKKSTFCSWSAIYIWMCWGVRVWGSYWKKSSFFVESQTNMY